jgi:undecaprenyl-diphosphatase
MIARGKRAQQPIIIGLVVSASILAICTLLASTQNLSILEQNIFTTIFESTNQLYNLALVITLLGSGWMVLGLLISLLILKKNDIALQVLILSSATYVVIQFMKDTIARPRPLELLSSLASRQYSVAGFGFPSGHSALSMVCALAILPYVSKPWKLGIILVVILIGLSRIYLGVHAPLDVIGGWSLAIVIWSLFMLVFSKNSLAKKSRKP